jgi:hypothetical protein
MTASEARSSIARVSEHWHGFASELKDFHDRLGWTALGHSRFRQCIEAELGIQERHAYRLLDVAAIRLELADAPAADPHHRPDTAPAPQWADALYELAHRSRRLEPAAGQLRYLDRDQRQRLLRTIRAVEAQLGEIATAIESSPSATRAAAATREAEEPVP